VKHFEKFLKWAGISILALIVLMAGIYALLPKGPRDLMDYNDRTRQPRQLFSGKQYAAVTGTPWATAAALSVLERGGSACDAAVSALLVLNITHGEATSFPGVAPALVYNAQTGQVRSYIGAGKAPEAATIERFAARGFKTVPELDIWAQLVPASPDVLTALLNDCGTLSFSELAAPAIQIAREGFPAHAIFQRNPDLSTLERFGFAILLPENTRVFLRGEWWRPIHLHDRMTFPDLANTLQALADAEQSALQSGGTRSDGIQAVRDYFYQGVIAQEIDTMHKDQHGLMTYNDLATYSGGWETPVTGNYGEYTFYGNGTWSQGIMEPLILQILEGVDLKSMGHNSPQYIHTVAQAIEIAMADRDAYVADPAFVNVPLETLLSKPYATQRREKMTASAFGNLPAPGEIAGFQAGSAETDFPQPAAGFNLTETLASLSDFTIGQDTSQVAIVDAQGNAVVITPSDFPKTPMLPGTGLNLGNRMNQFRLNPANVNALQPGKRPRITPHAVIVFKNDKFFMAYNTPGGDTQAQTLVQVFLNLVIFDMDIQQAISAPRFYSISAPSSFAPHEFTPGGLRLEADLFATAADGLKALGYLPEEAPAWDKDFGAVGAILRGADGSLYAGADPREETSAGGR